MASKAELIGDLKAMSQEISSLCGANQGLQSDSGFIDENKNETEKEIVSDISSMLTEMNEILDRMSSSNEKMRANDNSDFRLTVLVPDTDFHVDTQSFRRPILQALDISDQMIELESLTTECGCQQLFEKCKIS